MHSKPTTAVIHSNSAETIDDLIRNNYTFLTKRLQVEKLIPHFIEKRLLDFPEDKQVAMSKTTTPAKAEALLELLTQKGTCTPEEFVEILKKGDHQHVADQLKRTSSHRRPEAVDDVIDCLKDLYATEYAHVRPLPWCEDLNLHLGEVYTDLQLQQRDGRGCFQDTDSIVSLADIYKARTGLDSQVSSAVRKVRVEGDPGIGKSCSCQKLAYDWSCGKLDRFQVVFFLEMRHLAGKVKDEIFEQLLPKDSKTTPDQLWSYIQENQDDVLFILDGLDELSQAAREVTDVVDLIQGKILRNCHVLVTSRPYQCVKDLRKCHQFYKIVGYSRRNSEAFIHKYFSNCPESASKLIKQLYMYSNSNLLRIVVNPLNNVLICVVWEDNNKELPSNKAELYRDIVQSVAKRFCAKKTIPMEGDKLPPDLEEALRGLEKLSWEGLEQGQLQFNIDEITRKYDTTADNMLNMGLLTRDYSFSRIKRTCYCAFLHKTFQEYMAARYISGLVMDGSSKEEGMKCACRLFGLSDATVVNRELIVTCYRKYREVQNWLGLILCDKARPLFEKFKKELYKAQTDEDREALSFLCVMWLGTTCAVRRYIPRCGTESVFIRSKGVVIAYSSLLSTLEQLLAVARIEYITVQILTPIEHHLRERDTEFSKFDRLLARVIESHTRLRSLRLEISCHVMLYEDSTAKIFSNLTATLQSISEHTRLEVAEFGLPGKSQYDLTLPIFDDASVCAENRHETINVEPLVDKLTECVKKNKVLKTLRLRWGIGYIKGNRNKIYHGDCSDESLSSLCSAIRENRTLESLVVEGMLSHSEHRADMIFDLVRNKPSNYKKLSITLSDDNDASDDDNDNFYDDNDNFDNDNDNFGDDNDNFGDDNDASDDDNDASDDDNDNFDDDDNFGDDNDNFDNDNDNFDDDNDASDDDNDNFDNDNDNFDDDNDASDDDNDNFDDDNDNFDNENDNFHNDNFDDDYYTSDDDNDEFDDDNDN
uniref:NACHT domain-containing protein n=1 Tax=Branchiostoma floridae TaxID=7739 RepID=C3YNT6_BRAFL|eukprot:XP_002602034.1 hypothetical protein BRAFLDRAFT_82623 [Branchiostoma floridae]